MPFGFQFMLLFLLFPRFGSVCEPPNLTKGSAELPNRKFGRTLLGFFRFKKCESVEIIRLNDARPVWGRHSIVSYFFSEECSSRNGVNSGSCAEGFGVCCTCKSSFEFWCFHKKKIKSYSVFSQFELRSNLLGELYLFWINNQWRR